MPLAVDVKQCFVRTECNLYEKIFESIVKMPDLTVITEVEYTSKVKIRKSMRANFTSINLGSSTQYLSNFIARNLRYKDLVVHQTLDRKYCNYPKNEEMKYSNLYSAGPNNRKTRFLFCVRRTYLRRTVQ